MRLRRPHAPLQQDVRDTLTNAGKYDGRLGTLVAMVDAEHIHKTQHALPFHLEIIDGISHAPLEIVTIDHVDIAARALLDVVLHLDRDAR
jgi:hypothetical protein